MADDLDHVLLDARYADGGSERYQVFVGWDHNPVDEFTVVATIGADHDRTGYDALFAESAAQLLLQLKGLVSLNLVGKISFAPPPGGLVTTFSGVPDVPISSFDLTLKGGKGGPVAASKNLCKGAPQLLKASFTAHSGATFQRSVPLAIVGCKPVVALHLARAGSAHAKSRAIRQYPTWR